jgi:hypothetical protein
MPKKAGGTPMIKYQKKAKRGGDKPPEDISGFIYLDQRLSTQANIDPSYIDYGIIHLCDSVAINALRQTFTNFLNAFGNSGFDSTLYDLARNKCLSRLAHILDVKQLELNNEYELKISNIRFDIVSIDPSLITINAYGTLIGKKLNIDTGISSTKAQPSSTSATRSQEQYRSSPSSSPSYSQSRQYQTSSTDVAEQQRQQQLFKAQQEELLQAEEYRRRQQQQQQLKVGGKKCK